MRLHIAADSTDLLTLRTLCYGYQQGPLSTRLAIPEDRLSSARKLDEHAAAHYLASIIIGNLPEETTRYDVVNGDPTFFSQNIGPAPAILEEVLTHTPPEQLRLIAQSLKGTYHFFI